MNHCFSASWQFHDLDGARLTANTLWSYHINHIPSYLYPIWYNAQCKNTSSVWVTAEQEVCSWEDWSEVFWIESSAFQYEVHLRHLNIERPSRLIYFSFAVPKLFSHLHESSVLCHHVPAGRLSGGVDIISRHFIFISLQDVKTVQKRKKIFHRCLP